MPMLTLGNLIVSLPIYWIVGLQASFVKYVLFAVTCLVHATCAYTLGLVIGSAAPNAEMGQAFGPLILILFMLFSGLLANIDSIWVGIRWIQWIDLITYTYKAFGQNEFDSNLTFDCQPGARCFVDGLEVASTYSLNNPGLGLCIFINLGNFVTNLAFVGFYALLGIVIFDRSSAPIQKLK
jgi:ABC-2 type transporter